ncbi:hypothetical protein CLOP_g12182, partial [Closterium sp. NIES-67]
DKGQS